MTMANMGTGSEGGNDDGWGSNGVVSGAGTYGFLLLLLLSSSTYAGAVADVTTACSEHALLLLLLLLAALGSFLGSRNFGIRMLVLSSASSLGTRMPPPLLLWMALGAIRRSERLLLLLLRSVSACAIGDGDN